MNEMNPSLWMATTPQTTYPPASGDISVDVAVIGGGITGLTAALLLTRAGASVALVEAKRVASGVTGYTTAKVTSLHGLAYAEIIKGHGQDKARRYGEAAQAAIQQVSDLVPQRWDRV